MALKVSLEEEAARLKRTEDTKPNDAANNTPADQPMQEQEEEEHDEEYYLQQAIKMSMMDGQDAEQADEPKASEPAQNLKDIVTTDFMKDIIDEMDLDIDEGAMEDIMGQLDKKPDDKGEKPDEEKKD